MQDIAPVPRERKTIAAAGRLIVDAVDRMAGRVAEQQRADGTVADEENIAGTIARQHRLGLAHDARLRVDSALPAADAEIRLREN
jgi:hypothetical protein